MLCIFVYVFGFCILYLRQIGGTCQSTTKKKKKMGRNQRKSKRNKRKGKNSKQTKQNNESKQDCTYTAPSENHNPTEFGSAPVNKSAKAVWIPGVSDTSTVGATDGLLHGAIDGDTDGVIVGENDGAFDGEIDGTADGLLDGVFDGENDGETDGAIDGAFDGEADGTIEGISQSHTRIPHSVVKKEQSRLLSHCWQPELPKLHCSQLSIIPGFQLAVDSRYFWVWF